MKLSRILSFTLALIMVLALAAGCGGGAATTDTPQTEEPSAQEPTKAPTENEPTEEPGDEPTSMELPLTEETVSFDFYYPLQPFTMPYGLTEENMYNFQYLEEVTNVHMNMELISFMQVSDTFNIMIASEEYPDFITSFESYYANGADDAVENDIVIDLMPYMDNELSAYKAALDQDRDMWLYSLSPEGRLVSANYLMPGGEPATAGLMYRADWLEEFGMEVPETYDELKEFLVKARDEKGSKGFLLQDVGCDTEYSLSGGFGALGYTSTDYQFHPFLHIDDTVYYSPVTDEYRAYLEMLAEWYSEGLIHPDYASISWQDQMTYVARGEVALWSSSYDAASTVETNSDDTVHLRGMYQPTENAGDAVHLSKGITKIIYGTAISTQCENLDLALKWVNFCYTDEGSLIRGYGKEGETYNMENDEPVFTDLVLHNPDYVLIVAVNIYTSYGTPAVVDGSRYSGGWTDLDAQVIEDFSDPDRDWAYYIPATYVKIGAENASDFTAIMSDIATWVMQYAAQAITGEVDIAESWDDYVAEIDNMNLATALGYEQEAWNAYLAKEQYIPE